LKISLNGDAEGGSEIKISSLPQAVRSSVTNLHYECIAVALGAFEDKLVGLKPLTAAFDAYRDRVRRALAVE
jgi:hypothetical protein